MRTRERERLTGGQLLSDPSHEEELEHRSTHQYLSTHGAPEKNINSALVSYFVFITYFSFSRFNDFC